MRYKANTEIAAWRLVDGEAVIVHAETSAYYGLNATATFIWQSLLNGGLDAGEIDERVRARYGIGAQSVRADVEALLSSLAAEGLLTQVSKAVSGAASATAATATGAGAADAADADDGAFAGDATTAAGLYEPPQVERFGELEQLVLSGE